MQRSFGRMNAVSRQIDNTQPNTDEGRSRQPQQHATRYTLHATRHTLHATRYTLHAVTRYMQHATRSNTQRATQMIQTMEQLC